MKMLLWLMVTSLFLHALQALPTTGLFSQCGRPEPGDTGRIIGGSGSLPGDHPWQVSLLHRPTGSSEPFTHQCGGVLIKSCLVLTAAHCINRSMDMQVAVGGVYKRKEDTDQVIPVVRAIVHQDYREERFPDGHLIALRSDIALLELNVTNGPLCAVENRYVKTACLPKEPFPDPKECVVSGWGRTENDEPSDILLKAKVPLISTQRCSAAYPDQLDLNHICAGYMEGGIDACRGDSGGPLVCKQDGIHYVAGLVSWGPRCYNSDKPGVYTNVSRFVDWINGDHDDDYDDYAIQVHPTVPTVHTREPFSQCGRPEPGDTARIIGGSGSLPGDHPWQVSLQYRTKGSSEPFRHACGGVLIKSCWVLTAASCIMLDRPTDMQVVLGGVHITRNEDSDQVIPVVRAIVHEAHNPDSYSSDIALLELSVTNSPLCAVENRYVKTACLPKQPFPYDNECVVSGWGTTGEMNAHSDRLLKAKVPLISTQRCSTAYPNRLDRTMICAGYMAGGVDACNGDGGGPLMCKQDGIHYVAGLVSWGEGCGLRNKPSVYTNVYRFVDWINNKSHSPTVPTVHTREPFSQCGRPEPGDTARITGGSGSLPGDHPWQVSLQHRTKGSSEPFGHACGGVLIKSCWVLTAASCIMLNRPTDMQVVLGGVHIIRNEDSDQVIPVVRAIVHEAHDPVSYSSDIALLELSVTNSPLCAVETRYVKTACLPEQPFPDGKECVVSGWGTTGEMNALSDKLLKAKVPLISTHRCSAAYPNGLDRTMMCAGYMAGGVDPCSGDGGGPLMCKQDGIHYVAGLVSWGKGCGLMPKVYTNVYRFVDWINYESQSVALSPRLTARRS